MALPDQASVELYSSFFVFRRVAEKHVPTRRWITMILRPQILGNFFNTKSGQRPWGIWTKDEKPEQCGPQAGHITNQRSFIRNSVYIGGVKKHGPILENCEQAI